MRERSASGVHCQASTGTAWSAALQPQLLGGGPAGGGDSQLCVRAGACHTRVRAERAAAATSLTSAVLGRVKAWDCPAETGPRQHRRRDSAAAGTDRTASACTSGPEAEGSAAGLPTGTCLNYETVKVPKTWPFRSSAALFGCCTGAGGVEAKGWPAAGWPVRMSWATSGSRCLSHHTCLLALGALFLPPAPPRPSHAESTLGSAPTDGVSLGL